MDNKLLKDFIVENIVSASSEFLKKEKIREHIQSHIIDLIKSGDINNADDLREYFKSVEMASLALSSIPMVVWQKIAK